MEEERLRIMKMLAEHKINAEQAEKLLDALGTQQAEPEPLPGRSPGVLARLGGALSAFFSGSFFEWAGSEDQAPKRPPGRAIENPEDGFAVPTGASVEIKAKRGRIYVRQQDGDGNACVKGGAGGQVFVSEKGGRFYVWAWRNDEEVEVLIPPVAWVAVEATGGQARLDDVSGRLDLKVTGGALKAQGCAGKLKVKCTGGTADVGGSFRALDAKVTGGALTIRDLLLTEGEHRAKCTGGGIGLWLSDASSVRVEATSLGGNIRVDLPPARESREVGKHLAEYLVNEGAATLRIKSIGGGVDIHRVAKTAGASAVAKGEQ